MNKGEGYWETVARHGQSFEYLIDEVHAEIQAERKARGLLPWNFREQRERTEEEIMNSIMQPEMEQTKAGMVPKGVCATPNCKNVRHAADCTGYCRECKANNASGPARVVRRVSTPSPDGLCVGGCGRAAMKGTQFAWGHKKGCHGTAQRSAPVSAPREVVAVHPPPMGMPAKQDMTRLYAAMLKATREDIAAGEKEIARLEELCARVAQLKAMEKTLAIVVEGESVAKISEAEPLVVQAAVAGA